MGIPRSERNVLLPHEAAELKSRTRIVCAQILLGLINGGLSYFAYKHGLPLEAIPPLVGAGMGLARGLYNANELTKKDLEFHGVYPKLPDTKSPSRFTIHKREEDPYRGVKGQDPHKFEKGEKRDE